MEENKNIDLHNLDIKNVWDILEATNMDKLLGITQDEFMFIANLPPNMDEQEIIAQLAVYRNYKSIKFNNQDNK